MQLKFRKGLQPLTIAMVSMAAPFAYSDVDSYITSDNLVTNVDTARYFSEVCNGDVLDIYLKLHYEQLRDNWRKNTMFISNVQSIIDDNNFQSIVAMGTRAVPFIVDDISQEPSTLVWALNLIFKKKITNKPNVSIADACKLWVKTLQQTK